MWKLSAKWVPKCLNTDQKRQRCQSSEQLLDFFSARSATQMISCRDWWPWTRPGFMTMTRGQSNNQWIGGIAAHTLPPTQKKSECKNPLEKCSPRFFGIKTAPSHWLSSKEPIYQRGVLLISAGAIEGQFEGKTPREGHQGCLVLARQCPASPCSCNPEETGLPGLPMSWSPTLFSRSGPVGLPPISWTEKQLKGRHFSSDAEVIAAAET